MKLAKDTTIGEVGMDLGCRTGILKAELGLH